MNRIMHLSVCCLIIAAGCQSMDRPGSRLFSSRSRQQDSEEFADAAGLPPASQIARKHQDAESAEDHVNLGYDDIHRWQSAEDPPNLRANHLRTARAHFQTALKRDPQNLRARHGLAIVCDLDGDFASAERHYQAALATNPNDAEILANLGYSYLLQGRLNESEAMLKRALQIQPSHGNAVQNLGHALARQGRREEAIEQYSKIWSEQDVEKALAENLAKPSSTNVASRNGEGAKSANAEKSSKIAKSDQSLLDRLIPGPSKGEKILNDIQSGMEKLEEQRRQDGTHGVAQHRPQPPAHGLAQPYRSDVISQGERLKQQLAAIDQEQYQSVPNGPIMIDDRGRATQLPGVDHRGTRPQGFAPAGVQHSGPQMDIPPLEVVQSTLPAATSPEQMHAGGATQPANGPRPDMASTAQQQPWSGVEPAHGVQYDAHSGNGIQQTQGQSPPRSNANQPAEMFAGSPRIQSGWGSPNANQPQTAAPAANANAQWSGMPRNPGIPVTNGQPAPLAGGAQSGMAGPPGRFPAGHPMARVDAGQRPQGMGAPGQAVAGQLGFNGQAQSPAAAQNAPAGMNGGAPADPRAQQDAYREAAAAAARMGMGFGPGNMFPVFSQSAPVQAPGTGTAMNGTAFPTPPRHLPTNVPPLDLNAAYHPDPAPNTPPTSSVQTGPVMGAMTPTYTREQYGTASRFDSETLSRSGVPQSAWTDPRMEQYEAQRWEAGQQFNQAVQHVWSQGPTNSPVSPAAGSVYTYPNSQGPMTVPRTSDMVSGNPASHQPQQWPHSPQQQDQDQSQINPHQQSRFDTYANPTTHPVPTQPQHNVVTPPPYHHGGPSQPTVQGGQTVADPYANQSSYGLPAIRPSNPAR